MKTRFFTTLLIAAFIIPALLFGGWILKALIAFIIIFGGSEFLSLSDHKKNWPIFVKPVLIACIFVIILLPEELQFPFIGISSLFCFAIPVYDEEFSVQDAFLSVSFLSFFYLIATSFLTIYDTNPLYIWYIIFATYLCDTAAYFSGYFFGKHKLNPRISPKKTIEGAIGGWLFGAIGSFLFGLYFLPELSVITLCIASAILSVMGQIGDLSFSAMKRCFHVKDFSNLLPGHGGILDRLDSLIFNFICFYMILVVILS